METNYITTISKGLLIVGLLPVVWSAQPARFRTEIRANAVRVDTRLLSHRPAASVESLDEHPTVPKTIEAARIPERKRASGIHDHSPTALVTATNSPYSVAIEGNTSWSLSNNILNLKVDKVIHDGSGTTGSLRLHLWATESAYRGGNIHGYILGTSQFQSQLRPGQYYYNVNVNVPFTAPPDGNYYTTLALEEYLGSDWYIMSYVTYDAPTYFGAGGSARSRLEFQGTASWTINNNVLTIKVDKVVNNGSGFTGSLRVRLWATEATFGGGTIRGYVLGAYQFSSQLGPSEYFYGIDQQVQFSRPPDGTYHTTLTLEEYSSTGWVIRDYLSFNSTTTFGNPADSGDPCAYREINTYGNPVSNVLTPDSCLNGGYRVDGYMFFAVAGSRIQIVMRSAEFYTYQILFGPSGDVLSATAEDWNDGETVVTITAPETGQYFLVATSYDPGTGGSGSGGPYTLAVRVF
jgi:hypothetical protein